MVGRQRPAWLKSDNPIALREARRKPQQLPKVLRKLTEPWPMLGYATALHGFIFFLGLLGYSKINAVLPGVMLPFLTPFGTPMSVGILHTILYWTMLIGICNYTTYLIADDIQSGMWRLLRLTPHTAGEIVLAKIASVWRTWRRVFVMLLGVRIVAALLVPAATILRQNNEVHFILTPDLLGALVFIVQPLVDALLMSGVAALCALLLRSPTWANVSAYGIGAVLFGGLGLVGGVWMIYETPVGFIGGPLAILSHWAPLIASIVPGRSSAEMGLRILMVVVVYLILPIGLAIAALVASARLGEYVE